MVLEGRQSWSGLCFWYRFEALHIFPQISMFCKFDRCFWSWFSQHQCWGRRQSLPPSASTTTAQSGSTKWGGTHLRCVRKLPLTCPDPSHPGVGHDMPSVLTDFQENWEPLRYPSFCLFAAKGHPEALRWDAYFPVMWPWPSQPGTGHLNNR